MQSVIANQKKDPLGRMLLDHLKGHEDAHLEVMSTTFDMSIMTARKLFRTYSRMNQLEHLALNCCHGLVLDVGAGSGCHSLYLQDQGFDVDAIDISPGCIKTMQQRGVASVIHESLFSHDSVKYDTVLMLMNGIGICGSLDGLNLFLQYLPTILHKGGQVLVDSTDPIPLFDEEEPDSDRYPGETLFQMKYQHILCGPFEWLYIDFLTLQSLCHVHGFECEQIYHSQRNQFLARITLDE